MKFSLVADGGCRMRRAPELQARLDALWATIAARHAREFAESGWLGRCRLRCRMALAYWRERRALLPSPYALYAVRPAVSARPNAGSPQADKTPLASVQLRAYGVGCQRP